MRIVPKLNLNKTPETVDNNSLIFAKNIRLNGSGLSSDFGFERIDDYLDGQTVMSHIPAGLKIVGIIPYNTKFYIFLSEDTYTTSAIYVYNEEDGSWANCECNWNWSGGKIDGNVTVNLNGDIILTVAECDIPDNGLVPIKHINLTKANAYDDESIYTQSPNVPLINLKCIEKYKNTIPAGTYQFFIRYEIRKNYYTNWFPASKELFAGTTRTILTHQGALNYVDTKVDANESFVFRVEKIRDVDGYKSFQLGFILAHDDEVYARAYKHYELNSEDIYFDYDTEYIEEIDIKDITESIYNLYNVGNVTSFKNKLYISNYTESDFNPDTKDYANKVSIELTTASNPIQQSFAGYQYTTGSHDGTAYIASITITGPFDSGSKTVSNIIEELLLSEKQWFISEGTENRKLFRYGITANLIKYTEDRIDSGGEGEIPVGGEPQPLHPDNKYYLTSISGINTNSTTIDTILSTIAADILGIRVRDGKVMPVTWQESHRYTITKTIRNIHTNTIKNISITIDFSVNKDNISNSYSLDNTYSLVPHQKYAFYLHFVRGNGEITNGCRIPDYVYDENTSAYTPNITGQVYDNLEVEEVIDDTTGAASAIYPIFTFDFALPSEYVACFISIAHIENNVAQIFDIKQMWADANESDINSHYQGDCLELDTQLYPALKDIPIVYKYKDIIDNEEVEVIDENSTVDYHASYDNDFLATFGTSGKCITTTTLPNDVKYAFIKMPYKANEKYIQLTRCTPFITFNGGTHIYDDYNSLNLLGYVCRVSKPNSNYNYYYSNSDIYNVVRSYDSSQGYKISLAPLEDSASKWRLYSDSDIFTIYSNFNLNYISVRNTLNSKIVNKQYTENSQEVKSSYLLLSFDSIGLSEVYELASMYHSYARKLYYPYDTYNVITKFDNTIRSSELNGDEEIINTFKFKATDYYNVPTDKGKVVNLVAVGDAILVHTQDSIYKFSGQNSLTAQGGEDVQMKESEPFDTGIQELFGSEYGYAGLASKDHQVLSEFGYTFWDRDSGRIYLYTGNAQMKVLSDDISKLLRRDNKYVEDIYLADDYYNNRIFIAIKFLEDSTTTPKTYKYATLSYDFVAKSFISLHDFTFDWSFKTKTKCYFITKTTTAYNRIYRVSSNIGSYGPLLLDVQSSVYPKHSSEDCIVDIILNDRFESIKTLNSIAWVCNKIIGFNAEYNMAEENYQNDIDSNPENRYKGNYLRIYTDSCRTDKIDINNRSNDSALTTVNSYKQVRYNLGKWTYNYFRNILHRATDALSPRSDYKRQDTLIYGKYIVARFIFARNVNFKFEDVAFNVTIDNNI